MQVQTINPNHYQKNKPIEGIDIKKTDSLNFEKLYNGYLVKENIIKPNNSTLKKELNSISKLIRKEDLHKKENVDIILQYTKENGFYGVISSKTQGTPMHPSYKKSISKDKTVLDKFAEWVKCWDYMYSKK